MASTKVYYDAKLIAAVKNFYGAGREYYLRGKAQYG
jgi:hypothetical protein